jgi:lipopolysaccharide export system permease protein
MVVVLPVTLCGSIIFVYGKMMADNEMTVLRACGVSQFRLLAPALIVALAATALSYAMSLYFIPRSYTLFKDIQSIVKDAQLELLLREGTFNSVGRGVTIYFRERGEEGTLHDVLIHDARNPAETTTVISETAVVSRDAEILDITFVDGNLQRASRESGDLNIVHFDSYNFDFDTSSLFRGPTERERSISEMDIGELLTPPAETEEQRELAGRMLAEAHQRLATPLMCLTVSLMAGATMFAGQHRRGGHKLRLAVVGLVIAGLLIAFQMTIVAAASRAVLLPAIYLLVVLPALGSLGVLYVSDRYAAGREPWMRRLRRPGRGGGRLARAS